MRTALVTGGGGRLGRAIASALAESYANVLVLDIDAQAAASACDALGGRGRPRPLAADVSDPGELAEVRRELEQLQLLPDCVVCCAGISGRAEGATASLESVSAEAWRRVMAVNLDGVLFTCQAFVGAMRLRGWGRIVTVGSLAGRAPSATATLPYSASKAGLLALTRSLASELAPDGILVNAIAPGKLEPGWGETPAEREAYVRGVPLGRLATPGEVAGVVSFLASEQNTYMTGATVDVNGGRAML